MKKRQKKIYENVEGTWLIYSMIENDEEQFILDTEEITPEWFSLNVNEEGKIEIKVTALQNNTKQTNSLDGNLEIKENQFLAEFPNIKQGSDTFSITAELKLDNEFLLLNFGELKPLNDIKNFKPKEFVFYNKTIKLAKKEFIDKEIENKEIKEEEESEKNKNISIDTEEEAISYLKDYIDANRELPYIDYEISPISNKPKLLNNPYYIYVSHPDIQPWTFFVTKDGKIYDSSRCFFNPYSSSCEMPVNSEDMELDIV